MFGGNDFFDGMFDLGGDGMTDLGEQFLPFMIFQDMMHDDEDEDDWLSDALDDDEDADADAYIFHRPYLNTRCTSGGEANSQPKSDADTKPEPEPELPLPEHLTWEEYKQCVKKNAQTHASVVGARLRRRRSRAVRKERKR